MLPEKTKKSTCQILFSKNSNTNMVDLERAFNGISSGSNKLKRKIEDRLRLESYKKRKVQFEKQNATVPPRRKEEEKPKD